MGKKKKKNKKPVVAQFPHPEKRPVTGEPISKARPLSWRFSEVDMQGRWPWQHAPETLRQIIDKLPEFERLLGTGKVHHSPPISRLCKDARDRLRELEQDDIERLHSWRVGGTERLWCVERDGIMRILWWDPYHQVCPVSKKNT